MAQERISEPEDLSEKNSKLNIEKQDNGKYVRNIKSRLKI